MLGQIKFYLQELVQRLIQYLLDYPGSIQAKKKSPFVAIMDGIIGFYLLQKKMKKLLEKICYHITLPKEYLEDY